MRDLRRGVECPGSGPGEALEELTTLLGIMGEVFVRASDLPDDGPPGFPPEVLP